MDKNTAANDRGSAGRTRAPHLGPERRRPQILDAALSLAVEHGLAGVTIAAIAAQLDVTRPVIYAAFEDRDAVVAALLDREATFLADASQSALAASRADTPEEAFLLGYRAFLRTVDERPDAWRLLFQGRADTETVEIHQLGRTFMAEQAAGWIGPALASWWSTEDLERKLPVLMELFISSCEAAARSLLDPDSQWTADELAELYARVMCAAFTHA